MFQMVQMEEEEGRLVLPSVKPEDEGGLIADYVFLLCMFQK